MARLSSEIKERMRLAGVSQRQVATEAQIDPSELSNLLNGTPIGAQRESRIRAALKRLGVNDTEESSS